MSSELDIASLTIYTLEVCLRLRNLSLSYSNASFPLTNVISTE